MQYVTNSTSHELNVSSIYHQLSESRLMVSSIYHQLNDCTLAHAQLQKLHTPVNVRCHELSESLPQCVIYISSTQWVTNSMSHELNVSSKYHQLNVSTLAHPQLQKLHAPVNAIRHKLSESRTQSVSSRASRRVDELNFVGTWWVTNSLSPFSHVLTCRWVGIVGHIYE